MDENIVALEGSGDVLMFYDYRDLSREEAPDLSRYKSVDVAAWSMGVWAASSLLGRWGIVPRRTVALNGTERPVDDLLGIPRVLYALTERGMDVRGRERFYGRMLDHRDERLAFNARHRSLRPVDEMVEELARVREQAAAAPPPGIRWDKAYISVNDRVFPVENQLRWWEDRCEIAYLPGGHYPFFRFITWESLIDYEDN
jgi:biotin synthesis protein BioG